MVQMPVHPSKNWIIYTGKDGHRAINDAMGKYLMKNTSWDEDVAKCMLFIHLREGGVLRIKKEDGDIIVSMDGRLIKCDSNESHNMIMSMIDLLIDQLHQKVINTMSNGSEMDSTWYNQLPGVTKIKIYMRRYSKDVLYTMQHKMGRNGGKNFHTTGWLKLKEDEPRKTSNKT